jgi:ankyrin repeat protein
MRADRDEALRLRDPAVVAQNQQRLLEASAAAAEVMLACGFEVGGTGNMGETPLHWAAFTGNLAKARVLLAHGARVDLRDKVHDSPPLHWCFYSSLNQRPPNSDFPGVARALLEAGARPDVDDPSAADDVLEVVAEFRRRN